MLENFMDIFEVYTNEISAGVAILVLSAIYFKLKKARKINKKDERELIFDTTEDYIETKEVEVPEDIQPKTVPQPTPKVEKYEPKLAGAEEGSFGVTKTAKKEVQASASKISSARTKRSVPPHGKIKKDNFSEFKGQRILVAEDNLINQKVIGGLLADSGIEIVIADDGQIALDILEQDSNFNIILMDAHMPRVDGFEATRMIRKNPAYSHIVVVALSGDTAIDDIKKMTEAGMEEHLEKPLKMDSLYDILYAYTKNRDSDSDAENDEYSDGLVTKEIDTEKGLSICGYDELFYNEILSEFITTYSSSHIVLRDMLNNKQMKEADKYLLDISGTTSNIGADNISQIALALKNAINNPKERRYVRYYKQYVVSLQGLLKDIKEFLA